MTKATIAELHDSTEFLLTIADILKAVAPAASEAITNEVCRMRTTLIREVLISEVTR